MADLGLTPLERFLEVLLPNIEQEDYVEQQEDCARPKIGFKMSRPAPHKNKLSAPLAKKARKKHHKPTTKENLLGMLRKFSASEVRIPKEKTAWAKKMADEHLELIRRYCKDNSGGLFSHFEYTGSFYEHLKTVDADELDIMVALNVRKEDVDIEEMTPGYARLKLTTRSGAKYSGLTDGDYLSPEKVRRRFFSLVQKTVNGYKPKKDEPSSAELKLSDNGPATTLVIEVKGEPDKKLSIDLVPALLFKDKTPSHPEGTRHYVAKQYPDGLVPPCKRDMLWRRSFSLQEKHLLDKVDKKDNGCRRELIRIVKTIAKKDSTLAQLSSYHIKSAFLHYNFGDEGRGWSGTKLPERFLDFLQYLREMIKERVLSNYFILELNLLRELKEPHFDNIEGRLTTIIQNEQERAKLLKPVLEDETENKK